MLTNQGLARLQSFQRSAARVAASRATVKGTYTTRTRSSISTQLADNGLTVIYSERNGLTETATANPDGTHHSGSWSVWYAWSDEQRAKGLRS